MTVALSNDKAHSSGMPSSGPIRTSDGMPRIVRVAGTASTSQHRDHLVTREHEERTSSDRRFLAHQIRPFPALTTVHRLVALLCVFAG